MKWLDKYQYGGNVKKVDSVLNVNRPIHKWIDRLYEKDGKNIQLPGVEGTSTHYLAQFDNWAVPLVDEDEKGNLIYTENPSEEYINKRGIKFPSDKEALDFTQHYKEGTNVLKQKHGGWLEKYQNGGVIEDDRGQWAHPGKITRINSNRITMKDVNYPVLGVSDKGDKQIMYPEGEYTFEGEKVTEIPLFKAQTGTELDPVQQWNLDYVNSPKYKERLMSSGYENLNEEINNRAQNILDTNIYYENPGILGALKQFRWPVQSGSHTDGENINLDYPYDLEGMEKYYKEDMMSSPTKEEILAHELGHREISGKSPYGRLNTYDIRNLRDRGMNLPRVNAHDKKAKEMKSDLNAFRYNLMKQGIYDAGKEEFTKEHLKKAKKTFSKDRLDQNYSDKNLIWLMNNIAENNTPSNNWLNKYTS